MNRRAISAIYHFKIDFRKEVQTDEKESGQGGVK